MRTHSTPIPASIARPVPSARRVLCARPLLLASILCTVLVALAAAQSASDPSAQPEGSPGAPVHLRVEYKTAPIGIDTSAPRFSWELDDARRGAQQSAYRVLVSDNQDLLAQEKADQWDSGKVPLPDTNQVAFAGHPLVPWRTYWWTVRTWDRAGVPSPWSPAAPFTMGPTGERDWRAQWITPFVPRPAPAEGKRLGYHSTWSQNADDFKYVQIDLGRPRVFDTVVLHPARPVGAADEKGHLFPLRFKVYVDGSGSFDREALKIAEHTWQDVPDAGAAPMTFALSRLKFRFVRVIVEKMQAVPGQGHAFALGEFELRDSGSDIAPEGVASAGDSLEEGGWTVLALNDSELVPGTGPRREPRPAALLRKVLTLESAPERALLAASALGVYDITINGNPVGDARLAPGWTGYGARVPYQMMDVTPYLVAGDNAIGVRLAEGWYAGRIGLVDGLPPPPDVGLYGDRPQVRVQLQIEAGGKHASVGTDATWHWTTGGTVRSADLLDGVSYDSRSDPVGWVHARYAADAWMPALLAEHQPALFAQIVEPVRERAEIAAVARSEPSPGRFVYDFGQNISGVVRLRVPVAGFETYVLRHAEALDGDGLPWTDNLRSAAQTDQVVLRPGVVPEWDPSFTFHGFRYVEITGGSRPPQLGEVSAVPLTSDAREVGSFECSDPMLTRLWHNIAWTRRNTFLGVPLDAPQRDTRAGGLGEVLPFVPTAMLQADLASFFTQWLADVRAAQTADGRFTDLAPHPSAAERSGTPGWADAGVFVPWQAYLHYHDLRLLAASQPAMVRWIDFVRGKNPDLVWKEARGADLGDRFDGSSVQAEGWKAEGGEIPRDVFATAFFARSCELAAKASYALHKANDAERLAQLASGIRRAFREAFVDDQGRIAGDTQAGYALALDFGLFAEDARSRELAVAHLVRKIDEAGGALTTGMHTSHRALLALSRHGRHDLALKIAQRTSVPSWGHQIENGATTTWERWDGFVAGRGFQDPAHNSFDSVAFGSVGEWLMRAVAGIGPEDAHVTSGPVRLVPILDGPTRSSAEGPRAFEHVTLRPNVEGRITWARAEHASIAGRLTVAWKVDGPALTYECTIPANTSATLELPAKSRDSVRESDKPLAEVELLELRRFENGRAVIEVPAGTYRFTSRLW